MSAPTSRRGRLGVLVVVCLATLAQLACQNASPPPQPPASTVRSAPAPAPAAVGADAKAGTHYDLERDERRGGHTLSRHVGRSDQDLRDRLRREPGISAASTYTDRDAAEQVVAAALAHDRSRVDRWLSREGQRPNLTIDYRGSASSPIGRSLSRNSREVIPCSDALVVLRWDGHDGFYVLTSYPELRK